MNLEAENIQRGIEEALKALAASRGEEFARQIRRILIANLKRGRVQTFCEESPERIAAYVWLVADGFTALNGYLHRLQRERDAKAWEPLFERMQDWAYNFFLRKNFLPNDETRQAAVECATEAALNLLNAHFPYDTDFDAWAHVIVQNACRKFIDRAFRKSAVPENCLVELDDHLVNPDDPLLGFQDFQNGPSDELQAALAQLSEARRAVIQYLYFDDMGVEEVARKMGKTVGAVYGLQFHGLHDLRKILTRIRDSLNE